MKKSTLGVLIFLTLICNATYSNARKSRASRKVAQNVKASTEHDSNSSFDMSQFPNKITNGTKVNINLTVHYEDGEVMGPLEIGPNQTVFLPRNSQEIAALEVNNRKISHFKEQKTGKTVKMPAAIPDSTLVYEGNESGATELICK